MAAKNAEDFRIRLHVYDEEIEVSIPRSEEEYFRAGAKLVTERYNQYAQAFMDYKSDHSVALMTLVDIAYRLKKEELRNDTDPYDNILHSLTAEIEKALGEGASIQASSGKPS